jgi:archaellum component FlaF (FlaF/FlaG flagellin family)
MIGSVMKVLNVKNFSPVVCMTLSIIGILMLSLCAFVIIIKLLTVEDVLYNSHAQAFKRVHERFIKMYQYIKSLEVKIESLQSLSALGGETASKETNDFQNDHDTSMQDSQFVVLNNNAEEEKHDENEDANEQKIVELPDENNVDTIDVENLSDDELNAQISKLQQELSS